MLLVIVFGVVGLAVVSRVSPFSGRGISLCRDIIALFSYLLHSTYIDRYISSKLYCSHTPQPIIMLDDMLPSIHFQATHLSFFTKALTI